MQSFFCLISDFVANNFDVKKLLVFLLLLVCFAYVANCDQFVEVALFDKISAKRVCFLMQNEEIGTLDEKIEVVLSGNQAFCFCDISLAKGFYETHKDVVDGIQVYIEGGKPKEVLNLLQCQNLSSKEFDGGVLYEGYTSSFGEWLNDDGVRLNVQLYFKNGEIVLGLPFIFTGF